MVKFLHKVMQLMWRRKWQPTPVLLPGKSHGWRSLVGCSPCDHKESDMTEQLHFFTFRFIHVSTSGTILFLLMTNISLYIYVPNLLYSFFHCWVFTDLLYQLFFCLNQVWIKYFYILWHSALQWNLNTLCFNSLFSKLSSPLGCEQLKARGFALVIITSLKSFLELESETRISPN